MKIYKYIVTLKSSSSSINYRLKSISNYYQNSTKKYIIIFENKEIIINSNIFYFESIYKLNQAEVYNKLEGTNLSLIERIEGDFRLNRNETIRVTKEKIRNFKI